MTRLTYAGHGGDVSVLFVRHEAEDGEHGEPGQEARQAVHGARYQRVSAKTSNEGRKCFI